MMHRHRSLGSSRAALLVPGSVLILGALLAGCASTGSKQSTTTDVPEADRLQAETNRENASRGKLLAELDDAITAWNNLKLTGTSEEDQRRTDALALQIGYRARRRFNEIIDELQTGPPANRIVSAVALGFTGAKEALPPLVAALDDPDERVEINALIGLGVLADPATPVELLCERVRFDDSDLVRVQALYALNRIVRSGGGGPCVLETAREGLVDLDPGIQTQAALLVGELRDGESIDSLTHLLSSDTPLLVHAAARSITYLGDLDPHLKGPAARGLAGALDLPGNRSARELLIRHLMMLSKRNLGDETRDWVEWAAELP